MDHEEVLIGTVGRANGLKGDVVVRVRTDEPEMRFAVGAHVRLADRDLTIVRSRWFKGSLVVGFAEVTDRTAAERLRGAELFVDVDPDESPDDPDEYYDRQLRGLCALDPAGDRLGQVTDVLHLPAQDLLVIEVDGGERLVPFVGELVPEVDLDQGTLTIAEPGGLLDDQAEEAR
ncbi:ribosome maturation factor RimM [Cutibacterium granulosum]|jgi:hypothetical protein|uniref:ribosome maturation factor RimM n=1 Tax=Cutibacterium granulosum TaxID=33011 RepID=UPI002572F959|nr:ribosome maturation factor RimM [Cutibacterium granulosum]MDU1524114.1 ribosome maturation factor RimM [Cutibacterium granulosum]MDU4677944.1 ribosome maturation factor RimM [Cutibacterium granulosum]MDU7728531.1 ribosome maturation factor RimM [Cutibacterium granulosum]MEA5644777.1 ribosome maturation factor RimM [Cutibacterium granulosum]MEA5649161.1 ribosome maturation factor RimM [Cutibacterium granulosum]